MKYVTQGILKMKKYKNPNYCPIIDDYVKNVFL